jgi:alanine racemase
LASKLPETRLRPTFFDVDHDRHFRRLRRRPLCLRRFAPDRGPHRADRELEGHGAPFRQRAGGAVVKADAYGTGIEDAGEALYLAGARDFFVATVDEGVTLRLYAPEARIFVLAGIWPGTERRFFENDLVPVISSEEQLAFWMAVLADYGDYPCALHVDTGFNRLGIEMDEAIALADDVSRPASFSPVLVMSHLAAATTTARR